MARLTICFLTLALSASFSVKAQDTTRVPLPDSGFVTDGVVIPGRGPVRSEAPEKAVQLHARLTTQTDSLLSLLFGRVSYRARPDQPQASSYFDYDPHLFRLSSASWGELETVYPLGLAPATLSRSDDLFGEASLANPVPLPGSEEFLRSDPDDGYYFLSPTLSGDVSPFGRGFLLQQQRKSIRCDTAVSKVYVTRGTGGFSNTTFRFANRFGPAGVVDLDGTYLKKNGDFAYSHSRLMRLRLISQPVIDPNIETSVGFFLNRLTADKLYRIGDAYLDGDLSDHHAGVTARADFFNTDRSCFRARLVYRNDDQQFNHQNLRSKQLFRILDGRLVHQRLTGKHDLEFKGDLKYLHFVENQGSHDVLYYNLGGSDVIKPAEKLTAYASFSLRGSTGLSLTPTSTLLAQYQFDSCNSATIVAGHCALMPQAEMKYFRPLSASLMDDTTDYYLRGDRELESGFSDGVELFANHSDDHLAMRIRTGYLHFSDLPFWRAEFNTYPSGSFRPTSVDRNLFYSSLQTRLGLPKGIYLDGSYAFRHVFENDTNYTYGPQHLASVTAGIRFHFEKLKIMVNLASACKIRSASSRYLEGRGDPARLLLESYLSFDLKSFHFFYNYANLLGIDYSLSGYRQSGRALWWGFNWEFVD